MVVDAVVEVVRLELAQAVVLVQRGEQAAHRLVVRVHRAADVHEQQQADVVAARRAEDQLDLAGVAAGLVDGLVEVELRLLSLAGELAQAAQRDLHRAHVERVVGAVVLEAALLGDLHRRAALALAADADAGRMLAAVPERRLAAGADPLVAAVVALVLLLQALQEAAHQLVGGQLLEPGPLLGRQLGEVLRILQPLHHLLGDVVAELPLDALEDAREDPVVGVEVGLALDQAGAPEVVEAQQAAAVQSLLERAQERLPLLDGDRHAFVAQAVEEIEKHGRTAIGCTAGPGPPTSSGSGPSSRRSGSARRGPARS